MQIHELPSQSTTADTDQYPLDTGSTTRRISFANLKNQILQKANPAFTSGDDTTATSWTNVAKLVTGEVMTSVLNKISVMFKNVRYLHGKMGTTDISGIGGGTVTGAISALNAKNVFPTSLGVGKTSQQAAAAGFWANNAGNVHLTGGTDTGSYIYFYFNKATSATSYVREESSNHLYTNAYFRAKIYNGTVAQVVGSVPTDGNQIAYLSSNASNLFVNGQHGVTGTTFANKTIAFSTSDKRLKENVKDTEVDALPIVKKMRVVSFDWKDGREDRHQKIGMVADELEELDSKLAVGGGYAEDGSMNIKSVDTYYLVGYLVKAVQELSAEVEQLKRGR